MNIPKDDRRTILLPLLRKLSYKRGTFTLASGRTSDFYINVKLTMLAPRGLRAAAEFLWYEAYNIDDHVLGIAGEGLGGIPLATAIVHKWLWDNGGLVLIRKARKDHGAKTSVEAPDHLKKDARIVLVEDVATTGGSALRAVEALWDAGYTNVRGIVALVDRLEGARSETPGSGPGRSPSNTRTAMVPPLDASSTRTEWCIVLTRSRLKRGA